MSDTTSTTRLDAARIAARSQIVDVRALEIYAKLLRNRAQDRALEYRLDPKVTLRWEGDGAATFAVSVIYDLQIRHVPPDSDASDEVSGSEAQDLDLVAKLNFEFAALFRLDMRSEDAPPTERELTVYAETTGLFALHPFARELAHDLSARLGLPPLTLAVALVPTEGPPVSQDAVGE